MAQLVEHNLAKVGVAGSSPVVRSIWAFSSGGERFPDTEEVTSSNLVTPTKCSQPRGLASGLFCFGRQTSRQIRHQILNCLIFRNASQRLSVGTLKSFTCIQESFIDLRLGRMGPAGRDRNMLVKHNLLDSFGANGLVLVGFVGDLTKGVSKLPCR